MVAPHAQTSVDPITFEVLRHRLSTIVDEAAHVLREVSGSPVAAEVGDCNAALMDAEGNSIIVGPLMVTHALSCARAVKYVVEHYRENPGFRPGDMFLSNDPYRATPHQNCVVVVSPMFHGTELIAWTGAGIHVADVGGPVPGQVAVGARSIYEEPVPLPPIRMIEQGTLRQDIQEDYLIRSRTRDANALDLRAKIAANLTLQRRVKEVIDRYGVRTVVTTLARTIEYTAETIRERLRQIPDGRWTSEHYLDYDDSGELSLHQLRLTLTKVEDRMIFDFSGSSPQAPGPINCSIGGLQTGVVHVTAAMLGWGLPSCPAGVMRTWEIVSEPGTIVDAVWPAAMTKGTTAAVQWVRDIVTLTLSKMFAASEVFVERVLTPCEGFPAVAEINGIDQRGNSYGVPILDFGLSGGYGARGLRDGIHTAALVGSPGLSMANVEVYEQRYPLLYLSRREEIDTAGPGRFNGGSGLTVVVTPHDTDRIDFIYHSHGTHIPSTVGLHGGLPGSTNQFVVKRGTNVRALLASGMVPLQLDEIEGQSEMLPGIACSYLVPGDVYQCTNAGGGGYGDPLDRDMGLVAADVDLGYTSRDAAASLHGVVFGADRGIDRDETAARRERLRGERLGLAALPPPGADGGHGWDVAAHDGRPVTDRLSLVDRNGAFHYACGCGARIGEADRDYRVYLPRFDRPCSSAGPFCVNFIPTPPVVLRHYVCPSCGGLVDVEVVAIGGL